MNKANPRFSLTSISFITKWYLCLQINFVWKTGSFVFIGNQFPRILSTLIKSSLLHILTLPFKVSSKRCIFFSEIMYTYDLLKLCKAMQERVLLTDEYNWLSFTIETITFPMLCHVIDKYISITHSVIVCICNKSPVKFLSSNSVPVAVLESCKHITWSHDKSNLKQ